MDLRLNNRKVRYLDNCIYGSQYRWMGSFMARKHYFQMKLKMNGCIIFRSYGGGFEW